MALVTVEIISRQEIFPEGTPEGGSWVIIAEDISSDSGVAYVGPNPYKTFLLDPDAYMIKVGRRDINGDLIGEYIEEQVTVPSDTTNFTVKINTALNHFIKKINKFK